MALAGADGATVPGPAPGREPPPLLLVLAGLDDDDAIWFAHRARTAGARCVMVSTEALSFARRLSHRVSERGTDTVVELPDGTVLAPGTLAGVLNRCAEAPALAWRHAPERERAYAFAELHAFLLAWLSALSCPVRNRPTPECLAGPAPNPLRALVAAARAGLTCPDVRLGPDPQPALRAVAAAAWTRAGPGARPRQLVVLDGEVVGTGAPPEVIDAAARFVADLVPGPALVGLDFLVGGGSWWFAGLTPLPRLRDAGPDLVTRLVRATAPVAS